MTAPPRPKAKTLDVLFEAVQKMACVVFVPVVFMFRGIGFMVKLFYLRMAFMGIF